jgi:hypothetical protein
MNRFGKLAVFQVLVTAKGNAAYEFGWIGQIPMPKPWYWRSFADMVPLMDAAPRMSAIPMSEAARRPIDVSPKAANEKVLVRRPETRSGWRRLYYAFSQPQARVLIDELVLSLLPTIRLSDNPEQKIELDDLIFFKYTLQGVGVAPPLHWDGYWGCFPDSAGFQLFYMAEPPARHLNGTGSLVVADSKRPGGEPVIYESPRPGVIELRDNDGTGDWRTARVQKVSKSWADTNISGFHYVDARGGDVLVMGKRTLHQTDVRPNLRGMTAERLAAVVRVIVKPNGWVRVLPKCKEQLIGPKLRSHIRDHPERYKRHSDMSESVWFKRHDMTFW